MEKKINIAELLKDCPKGMELDCLLFKDAPVYFDRITNSFCYPIEIKVEHPDGSFEKFELSKEGCIYDKVIAKCVIFPKGKTTWEGFVPPCKFKDGDIVTCTNDACTYTAIFKEMIDKGAFCHYGVLIDNKFRCVSNDWSNFNETCRLATEEEKSKLFDAIKANGYKWNEETKTLEKLPKFKVGDRIKLKNTPTNNILTVTKTNDDGSLNVNMYSWVITYELQDKYELVPNNHPKFKVGNKIKKKGDARLISIKDVRDDYYIITIPDYFDNCYITDKLSFSNQDDYELVHDKFDITTLKPFDKVLVRDCNADTWDIDFFGYYRDNSTYQCMTFTKNQCIPYEGNEHLLSTIDDCDEYYKTW